MQALLRIRLRSQDREMSETRRLSDLFEPQPAQWGLRGDPHLWREMATALRDVAMPNNAEQLTRMLEESFAQLVALPLHASQESVFVERYSRGGMSSGRISFDFWRNTAMPLLLARYAVAATATMPES
jgi:hypothetical protein